MVYSGFGVHRTKDIDPNSDASYIVTVSWEGGHFAVAYFDYAGQLIDFTAF